MKLIQSLQDDSDSEAPALVLAQTFLLQDWMQPKEFCCTKVGICLNTLDYNVSDIVSTVSSLYDICFFRNCYVSGWFYRGHKREILNSSLLQYIK